MLRSLAVKKSSGMFRGKSPHSVLPFHSQHTDTHTPHSLACSLFFLDATFSSLLRSAASSSSPPLLLRPAPSTRPEGSAAPAHARCEVLCDRLRYVSELVTVLWEDIPNASICA